MAYYNELITEKSLQILQNLKREFNFILIGGWAVFFYAKTLKSKDIDVIVDYDQLEKIKTKYDLIKNDRLKKYEIKLQEIDVDIYLPHFSFLGLPVEEVSQYAESRDGFFVAAPEILLVMKQFVYGERRGTSKGEKDKLDILSLLSADVLNWGVYKEIIAKHKVENYSKELKEFLRNITEAKEIGLNQYKMSRLKKDILAKL